MSEVAFPRVPLDADAGGWLEFDCVLLTREEVGQIRALADPMPATDAMPAGGAASVGGAIPEI